MERPPARFHGNGPPFNSWLKFQLDNLNLIYDSSVNSAPAGFKTALNFVVSFFNTTFSNPVTINIDVGWGEVDGQSVGAGALGESINQGANFGFSQLRNALAANAGKSATDASVLNSLASTDPTGGSLFDIGRADAKALGLLAATNTATDGWIGFANSSNTFAFDPNNRAISGLYDFVGVAFHEITEVMGRVAGLSSGSYSMMDLLRYSVTGVRALAGGTSSYFSVDGGKTNLDSFNTRASGDYGDWASSAGNDAFLAFSNSGVVNAFTNTDKILMDALGWNVGGPTVVSIAGAADNHATSVTAAHTVTITLAASSVVTVVGTPTLQLNDNQVALYTDGSGTTSLTFAYAVQPGDHIPDLQVTGLNLPTGSSIQDPNFANLSGPVTGDLAMQIDGSVPPATTVQQEILGLYAALYNRSAEGPGYSYWVGVVNQQQDSGGVTLSTSMTKAVTLSDAQLLGQMFVTTQSAFFTTTYGGLTDGQFVAAIYTNIGGNAGDASGIQYWSNQLATLESQGQTVQNARAQIVGQFVHDLIDINLATQPSNLTVSQYQAALQRQATLDNKIAVSNTYDTMSLAPNGAILVPHTVGDAAYQGAVNSLQGVTSSATTPGAAIAGIHAAVDHQSLSLIVAI